MLACKMWVWSAWMSVHIFKLVPEMQRAHHIHNVSCSIRAKNQKHRLLPKFELLRKQRGYIPVFFSSESLVMCVKRRNWKCVWNRELVLTSGGWSRATRHPLVHPLSLSTLHWPLTSGWEGDVSQELESLLFPASSLPSPPPPLKMPSDRDGASWREWEEVHE